MTSLSEHIERQDLRDWASLTKRTAQSAVEAAQQTGQPPPAQLLAVSQMSESDLIDNYRKNGRQQTRVPPTLRQRLTEADHLLKLAHQQRASAIQDKADAKADAKAAREEAAAAVTAADEAREGTRTAREELARKELQRTVESRNAQQELEDLRNELAKAHADVTAADANAAEAAQAAEAAKEREAAALDKFARQGAQLAGEQRQIQTALDNSRSRVEELLAELDRVRADAGTQIAAAVEKATAAEQRAEERIAERAADRQESEAELDRLRGELEGFAATRKLKSRPPTSGLKLPKTRRITAWSNARQTERAPNKGSPI